MTPPAGSTLRLAWGWLLAALSGSMAVPVPMAGAQTQATQQSELPAPDAAPIPPVAPSADALQSGAAFDPLIGNVDDPMPDIGVDWPDLVAPPPAMAEDTAPEPAPTPGSVAPPSLVAGSDDASADGGFVDEPGGIADAALPDDGQERRYTIQFIGLEDIGDGQFEGRFHELSQLEEGKGEAANIAQINRRMRQDSLVIEQLLRAKGYYDARIRSRIVPSAVGGGRLTVRFEVFPGDRYRLERVTLVGLPVGHNGLPMFRSAFPVRKGDPVDADRILAAQTGLTTRLLESGYPFAQVDEPLVTIDHDTRLGEIDATVRPGGFRQFGIIRVTDGERTVFPARHVQEIARFKPDHPYAASDVEDLRRAIIQTGLVSSVTVKPVEAGDEAHVNLDVAMTPAPVRTIAGEAGYGTGEGARVGVSWQHRNLFQPEGALTLRAVAGTREQLVGVDFRRNNFRRRDHVLSASLTAQHVKYNAYTAQTLSLTAGWERQSNILYQKRWSWRIGGELAASKERDRFGLRALRENRTYFIAALPMNLNYDGSDDLLNPTRGVRAGIRLSPEVSLRGRKVGYLRAQFDSSGYIPAGDRVVLAGRVRLGTIAGTSVERVAPSRRFYSGGGASVRGFGYQALGPKDILNDPRGGRSLLELSAEARIRFGDFGVVPFVDAGNVADDRLPRFGDLRYAAGLGLRYYSNFGPIRIDVGTPLKRKKGENRVAVSVSLGQAF